MKQFVPMSDEMLYQTGFLQFPLVPYQVGLNCLHSMEAGAQELADEHSQADEHFTADSSPH